MNSYERFVELNNTYKQDLYNRLVEVKSQTVKDTVRTNSKFELKRIDKVLYLVNENCNRKKEIKHLSDLYDFYKTERTCYITNISFLKNYKNILSKFVMTEDYWLRIRNCIYKTERFSILRMDNLDSFISKMLLMNRGIVVLDTPLYKLVKLSEKEMILVTDLNIIVLNEHSFTFNTLQNLQYVKITNVKLYDKGIGHTNSLHNMFADCSKLKEVIFENFDTREVIDMGYMFDGCADLVSVDIACFDTRYVCYMDNMFRDCGSLKYLDLEHFNVGLVKDFSGMFSYCMNLNELKITSWNIGEKRYSSLNLSNMFRCAENIQGLDMDKFTKFLEDQTVITTNMFRNTPYMDKV